VRGAGRIAGSMDLVEAAELGVEVVLADPE
jgi:hypothetical protein